MYSENNLLPLSALQHIMFCERQCALIHLEQVWTENRLTVEGRHLHERVDARGGESRGDVRTEYGVFVRSLRLGISGIADAVEFCREEDGLWRPFPVEYKRGRPKKGHSDEVQLCAQAMCLEEMLDIEVPEGALFYGKTRRRADVLFDSSLRSLTENAARRLHDLIDSETTPAADFGPKCRNCSLKDTCMPRLTEDRGRVNGYLAAATHEGNAT